jgi:hypothetical protein
MMGDVRDFLKKYNSEKGYGVTDEDLRESLAFGGVEVWSGSQDEHRWFICIEKVRDFDGTFILFGDFIITGDNCMSDMDLEYDLDAAKIVERKERTITEIYYEERTPNETT